MIKESTAEHFEEDKEDKTEKEDPLLSASHRHHLIYQKTTPHCRDMNQVVGVQSPHPLPHHSAASQAFCQEVEPI